MVVIKWVINTLFMNRSVGPGKKCRRARLWLGARSRGRKPDHNKKAMNLQSLALQYHIRSSGLIGTHHERDTR
jgi:hypothetical protein